MAYNDEKLSGKNLRRCYEIASPRVKRYLLAEIGFVRPGDHILELGCGYGRICFELEDMGAQAGGLRKPMWFSGSRCPGHRIRGRAIRYRALLAKRHLRLRRGARRIFHRQQALTRHLDESQFVGGAELWKPLTSMITTFILID